MKYCTEEGCEEQILDWQNYCYKHGGIKMEAPHNPKQAQQMPQPPHPSQPIEPMTAPKPEQPNPVGHQEKAYMDMAKLRKEPGLPVFVVSGELPKLEGKERLIVKQVAFKEAVSTMLSMEDFQNKQYDTMLGELQRLTVDYYKIIVSHNESS